MRFMKSGSRCFIIIALLVCAGALFAGGTSAEAAGTISGKVVREGTTDPIPGLNVYALNLSNDTAWAGAAQTGADGTYAISNLAAGQYKVYAYSSGKYYLSEWYDNVAQFDSAATVTVNDGQTTPSINFSLTLGGLIYGKVTPYSSSTITGLGVYAYNVNTGQWPGRAQPGTTDGAYAIALEPGQYKVYAEAAGTNYASEWYYNAYFDSATTVNVAGGQTTMGINFTLEKGGSVSGKVTKSGTTEPVLNLKIRAYDFASDSWAGETKTKADGTYIITGLAPGQYRVHAETAGTDYASQWYDNALYESAIPVNVRAEQTTQNINFSLARGGGVSGKVTKDGTTDALSGLQVSAFDLSTGYWAGSAETGTDGTYAITGLAAGQYRVHADASGTTHVSEYYDNTLDYDSAATVNVTAGQTTANIDFGLALGDSISGKVTREGTTTPIVGITVYANSVSTDEWFGPAWTGTGGTYAISGLAPGQYRVYAFASASNYVSEYFNNVPDFDSAQTVTVQAGLPTQNIDFSLAPGGTISGTVGLDGTAGFPPPGLLVYAYNAVTNEQAGSARTQTDGTYIISGLSPGQYRVQISSSGTYFISEWYNNVLLRDAATLLTVAANATTEGINFAVTVYPLTTVTTAPEGLQVMVDGKAYSAPQTFGWKPGSAHTIGVTSPQTEAGDTGTQYEFHRWSDGKAQTHAVTAAEIPFVYMASFGRMIGDLDGSRVVDIRDAVLALQVISGMTPVPVSQAGTVVAGEKIGMAEAIYILQKAAGLR